MLGPGGSSGRLGRSLGPAPPPSPGPSPRYSRAGRGGPAAARAGGGGGGAAAPRRPAPAAAPRRSSWPQPIAGAVPALPPARLPPRPAPRPLPSLIQTAAAAPGARWLQVTRGTGCGGPAGLWRGWHGDLARGGRAGGGRGRLLGAASPARAATSPSGRAPSPRCRCRCLGRAGSASGAAAAASGEGPGRAGPAGTAADRGPRPLPPSLTGTCGDTNRAPEFDQTTRISGY